MAIGKRPASPDRYPRTARVNELLREIIAEELEKHSDEDPRLELVTITGVDSDPDFRHAKVFFSALDTQATAPEVVAALDERRVPLQKLIGRNVRIKNTPQLTFHADPAIVEGGKVEEILRTLDIPSE